VRYLNLIRVFVRASAQQEMAYRANFFIHVLHSILNLGTGVLGIWVLFEQVENLGGWDYPSALAVVGIYLLVSALRDLFIAPGLEALAGMGQEIMTGNFDFTLLRPVDTQFLVTFRHWQLYSLFDLALALGVIGAALHAGQSLSLLSLLAFFFAMAAAVMVMYAVYLAFTALVFVNPALFFTWVIDAIFQLARYPVGIYPDWLRFMLTWVIPLGLMTTIPAQALTGKISLALLFGSFAAAFLLLALASLLFRRTMRAYTSASS